MGVSCQQRSGWGRGLLYAIVAAELVAWPARASAPGSERRQAEPQRAESQRLDGQSNRPISWQTALRLRADFESAPEGSHTRADYAEVMDGFRAIYHSNPGDPHAARAAVQVAELLGEQGRELDDRKSLRDAAGQYEFVARAYPETNLSAIALSQALDLLGPGASDDPAEARRVRAELLRDYPESAEARSARADPAGRVALPQPARSGSGARSAVSTQTSTAPNSAPAGNQSATAGQSRAAIAIQPGAREPAASQAGAAAGTAELRSPAPIVRVEPPSSAPAPGSAAAPANAYRGGSSPTGGSSLTGASARSSADASAPATYDASASRLGVATDVAHDVAREAPRPNRPMGPLAVVTGIRHWSTSSYTRVAIDLTDDSEQGIKYQAARVENPDRIYFDLHHTKLTAQLEGKIFNVTDDGFLTKIRAARSSDDVTRVVLDVHAVSEYSAFLLPNPYRLIIDIHGRSPNRQEAGDSVQAASAAAQPIPSTSLPANSAEGRQTLAAADSPGEPGSAASASSALPPMPVTDGSGAFGLAPRSGTGAAPAMRTGAASPAQPVARPRVVVSSPPTAAKPVPNTVAVHSSESGAQFGTEVAAVSQQPGRVEATSGPTSQPIVSRTSSTRTARSSTAASGSHSASPGIAAAGATASSGATVASGTSDTSGATDTAGAMDISGAVNTSGDHYRPRSRRTASGKAAAAGNTPTVSAAPAEAAAPTAQGQVSMVRALGLKIGRIVIDAGHGGHDSGTLGAGGIEEKDVVLDVALRLGKLLHDRLGAEIVYTRADDTFIPLETRTAIANKAQADLFVSVHANSSSDPTARGVEVYYLNFTSDPDAMRVAARENAVSTQSVHELSDLVKQIALKDKIDESRELASDVDASLFAGLTRGNAGLKNRGVKKAPFVVLIGANMPSILAEISFVTNPDDADKLERPEYRERVAESLYAGVARYEAGINGSAPRVRTTEQARR